MTFQIGVPFYIDLKNFREIEGKYKISRYFRAKGMKKTPEIVVSPEINPEKTPERVLEHVNCTT